MVSINRSRIAAAATLLAGAMVLCGVCQSASAADPWDDAPVAPLPGQVNAQTAFNDQEEPPRGRDSHRRQRAVEAPRREAAPVDRQFQQQPSAVERASEADEPAMEVNPRYRKVEQQEPPAALPEQTLEEPRRLPRPIPTDEPRAERQVAGSETRTEAQGAPLPPDDRHRPIPLAPQSLATSGGFGGHDLPPAATAGISLGIVLGLFLMVAWALKRGMPKNVAQLPREAVEVMGRTVLTGRQQVHLVRCGNKMLLVCVSPGGIETLTEITDPVEVDRLAGLCQQSSSTSATANFRQVFQQLGKQSRSLDYLTRAQGDSLDFGHLEGRSLVQESHA